MYRLRNLPISTKYTDCYFDSDSEKDLPTAIHDNVVRQAHCLYILCYLVLLCYQLSLSRHSFTCLVPLMRYLTPAVPPPTSYPGATIRLTLRSSTLQPSISGAAAEVLWCPATFSRPTTTSTYCTKNHLKLRLCPKSYSKYISSKYSIIFYPKFTLYLLNLLLVSAWLPWAVHRLVPSPLSPSHSPYFMRLQLVASLKYFFPHKVGV